ncbi:MAG: hypothetical protein D6692_06885 [Planctomycetota bacterium]|nr:MAG: hypothetical protein D6692_06885 [Planctomycetota bacterium]
MVSQDTINARQVVLEKDFSQKEMLAFAKDEMWWEHQAEAVIPVLRAYINGKILGSTTGKPHGAEVVWDYFLTSFPVAAADAVMEIDTRYVVWSLSLWPAAHDHIKPAYREYMMFVVIDCYERAKEVERDQRAAVDSLAPVDRTPPEGLPFGTDPAGVQDPNARKEFARRLAEIDHQRHLRAELDHTEHVLGMMEFQMPDNARLLLEDASVSEQRAIRMMIEKHSWWNSGIVQSMGKKISWLQKNEDLPNVP